MAQIKKVIEEIKLNGISYYSDNNKYQIVSVQTWNRAQEGLNTLLWLTHKDFDINSLCREYIYPNIYKLRNN